MRQLITERRALFALVAALATIASIIGEGAASAQTDSLDTNRVKIIARLLDGGRIEFALLQARYDRSTQALDWSGNPIKPSSRYFPASPDGNGWLYASPQALRVGGSIEYTVRIAARRLADGRTEFGLQPRVGTGWGSMHLPPSRFFPADVVPGGGWLRSSEINLVDVDDPVPANVPVSATAILRRADLDGYSWNGLEPTLYYGTKTDELDDTLFTWVVARARTDDRLWDTIRLQAGCLDGRHHIWFWEDSLPFVASRDLVSVRWRIDDGEIVAERWSESSGNEDTVYPSDRFKQAVVGADKLVVRMSFYSHTLTATFTGLRAMWNTPVQPNLDYCGRY